MLLIEAVGTGYILLLGFRNALVSVVSASCRKGRMTTHTSFV